MPTPAYISIKGKDQGHITEGAFTEASVGNIWQEGHENEILVQAIDHKVLIPRDPQSGQPSGQRTHLPFKFTASLNKAVPLLYNALTRGEELPEVVVRWYRTSSAGKQEHFFTTRMIDATVVDIDCQMPHCQDHRNADFTQLVAVSLAYRRIEWEHGPANSSGADDWRKPRV